MKLSTYLVKAPAPMLQRWHEEAARRGISLAQLIRETMNKEIDDPDFGKHTISADNYVSQPRLTD